MKTIISGLVIKVVEMLATKVLIPWLTGIFNNINDRIENKKEEKKAKEAAENLKKAIDETGFKTAVDRLP